ncbi:MBL fold metallo-hydrolase [Novosphingobium piscinae]|uniref:MBL fold metallo-hydrolase n=1 Tax=Novosphingobium piscinae TaxID=1507448 RepID=A0A7X1KNL5_9SPHN|nr:MBL fold metallo-hydrolase [Novosphingobium piscinae]
MTPPFIEAFFDEATNTVSYLVGDPDTRTAAVIDPVLDFDMASGVVDTRSADRILAFARDQDWHVAMVLETHAHADHLSAGAIIKARTGAWIGIGRHIRDAQRVFGPAFAMTDLKMDGSDFDRLFDEGDAIPLGSLTIGVMHLPGHTSADVAYRIGDAVFVGDTLFMPDYGTARTDFPGGDARTLYRSIRRLLALPDETRLFLCHDYKAPGREDYRWETTVGEQRRTNIHVNDSVDEAAFVALREGRDAALPAPRLLLPSIQVNIRAGRFGAAEPNGVSYLRIPVKWRSAGA